MFRFRVPLAIVAVLTLASGCSAASGGSETPLTSGDAYSISGALAEIPAEVATEQMTIMTGDLATATTAAGSERPSDTDELIAWARAVTGRPATDGEEPSPVFVPFASSLNLQHAAEFEEIRAELGWSLVEVDAFVELTAPPQTFTVVTGDLTINPELPDVADGVVTAGQGEDSSSDLEARTPARPIGVPLRMAQQDSRVVATPITEHASSWLDGAGETLAQDETLAPLAAALDEVDVYSAVLMSGYPMSVTGGAFSPEQRERMLGSVEDYVPEDPFTAVALGWHLSNDEAVVTVAYLFASPEAAERAVPVLNKQHAEGFSLRTMQPLTSIMSVQSVAAVDSVVVVTATPAEGRTPDTLYSMLNNRDLPFLHQ